MLVSPQLYSNVRKEGNVVVDNRPAVQEHWADKNWMLFAFAPEQSGMFVDNCCHKHFAKVESTIYAKDCLWFICQNALHVRYTVLCVENDCRGNSLLDDDALDQRVVVGHCENTEDVVGDVAIVHRVRLPLGLVRGVSTVFNLFSIAWLHLGLIQKNALMHLLGRL